MSNISKDVKSEYERVDRLLSLEFGEYWRYTPVNEDSEERTTLLVSNEIYIITDLLENLITNDIQTVEIYANKRISQGSSIRLDFERFTRDFTPVPKSEAEAIRKQQLLALQHDAEAIQADIQLALTDPNALLRLLEQSKDSSVTDEKANLHSAIGLPSPDQISSRSKELIPEAGTMGVVQDHKKRFENQATLGRMANKLAASKSKELANTLEKATSLMMETAKAMTGKSNDMLRKVGNVMIKIDIMKHYLGEDVEIVTLIDGDVSTSNEPISLYSSMVYMDEEIAVNEVYTDSQDFDYSNADFFIEYLKATPSLIERIFPSERAIITIRPTRREKHYADMSAAQWATRNSMNKAAFLMVRDGQRISAIYSPVEHNARLFPIQSEMNDFFDNVYSRSTKLVDKQREFKTMSDTYHKLVAILQGVKDRQLSGGAIVFGDFPREAQGKSLLEEAYIKQNCTFVDIEDNLLGDGKKSPAIEIIEAAELPLFSKGDIAIYSPKDFFTQSCIPSAFKVDYDENYRSDWDMPDNEISRPAGQGYIVGVDSLNLGRITLFSGEPILMIELKKNWPKPTTKNFRAFPCRSRSAINLMTLKPSFVESAINSKLHRSRLFGNDLMIFLVKARQAIKAIQAQTADIKAILVEHYPMMSDDDLHMMIMDWYRDYDGTSPIKAKAAATSIVNNHNKVMAFNKTSTERATALIVEMGDVPLYASKVGAQVFIIAASNRLINGYGVKMYNSITPFFACHQLGIDGSIANTEIVGSEVQTYPVSQALHDDLARFNLSEKRLNGNEYRTLRNMASKNKQQLIFMLNQISHVTAMDDDEDKDEAIMTTINEMIHALEEMDENTKQTNSKVGYGISVTPYLVSADHKDNLSYSGFGINLPRAISFLFANLSKISQKTYEHDINDSMLELLGWDRCLKDFKDIDPRGDATQYLGEHSDSLTKQSINHLIYSQKRALSHSPLSTEPMFRRESDTLKTKKAFIKLLNTELNVPLPIKAGNND